MNCDCPNGSYGKKHTQVCITRTYTERDKLKEAAEHCLKIFMSMADRGHYPEEVLPHSEYYLGKQGLEFLTDALKD